MTIAYLRYSTDKQDERQQIQAIKDWATPRGIIINAIEIDEGVSGGISYKDRKLYGIVQSMGPGDTLVCSEVSRLGRSMSDLTKLISDELKPRKIRLICIKVGLDIDCGNLKAIDEMLLMAFGFAAQVEKEMIQARTQSALDARKEALRKDGGFFSKSGRWCRHLGNAKGVDITPAVAAQARIKADEARAWREQSDGYRWVKQQVLKGRKQKDILREFNEFHEMGLAGFSTREGCAMNICTLSKWMQEIKRQN